MAKRDEICPKERLEGSSYGIMASEVIREMRESRVSSKDAHAALVRKRFGKSGPKK